MVLTQLTQTAIAILNDITLQSDTQSANISLSSEVWKELFRKLESGGLVRRLPGKEEFVLPPTRYAALFRNYPYLNFWQLLMNLSILNGRFLKHLIFITEREPRNWESLPRWCVYSYPK